MQNAGAVPDASFFWWAIRPSAKFPTLELRIADVCTYAEDGVALAILFRCLVATLVERPALGAHRTTHTRRIIDENRWRAKRDGIAAKFIEESSGAVVTVRDLLARALDIVAPKARELDCVASLRHVRAILDRGTSAHAQLREYNERRVAGATQTAALHHVVDWLVDTTVAQSGNELSVHA
jgi:carboxylate-amine ligase